MSRTGWTDAKAASAEDARSLRRQRNRATTAAAACIACALAAAVPRAVRNYREQETANAELVALQANIVANQDVLRKVQAEIVRVQKEINARLNGQP